MTHPVGKEWDGPTLPGAVPGASLGGIPPPPPLPPDACSDAGARGKSAGLARLKLNLNLTRWLADH